MRTKIQPSAIVLLVSFFPIFMAFGQEDDTSSVIKLDPVTLRETPYSLDRMPKVDGSIITAGKKTEVIHIERINANLVTNNMRQIFSRIPGITIWENDGSGIQIGVSRRGLSPNRSWEFNTRQNGYDISADVFGYPEAYFNPPMESVEKVQLISGAAGLQFGPQYGGLLNYELKKEKEKPFSFESQHTLGSYSLFSTYNAIGGSKGRITYQAFHQQRAGEGWRENGRYRIRTSYAFFQWQIRPKISLSVEYTHRYDLIQQSGGLTDSLFQADPRQSLRSRNWFSTPWQLAAIKLEARPGHHLLIQAQLFGLLGERNSIGFIAKPNVADTINSSIVSYNPRQADRDAYKNLGLEYRMRWDYALFGHRQFLSSGLRAYQAHTYRQQKGVGSTRSDFDMELLDQDYPVDLNYKTLNLAFFAENIFRLSPALSVSPGFRIETVRSAVDGQKGVQNNVQIMAENYQADRLFLLGGISAAYQIAFTNLYGGISQAYRPILFSDLLLPSTSDIVDPDLHDARGYSAELGWRGSVKKILQFDLTAFYIYYNDRIGSIAQLIEVESVVSLRNYRTNLGKSANKGIELFLEADLFQMISGLCRFGKLSALTSVALLNAEYGDYITNKVSGSAPDYVLTETNLKGNKIEYAPAIIASFGISFQHKGLSIGMQARYSSEVFSDASNTELPSSDGTVGRIDGYNVWDISAQYHFLERFQVKGGINNLLDSHYATRRSGGYPGPGLLPGEGRTFYVGVGYKW